MAEQEIWKPIPGYPDYEVSNLGRIKSLKRSTPRILRPAPSDSGHLSLALCINGIPHQKKVHQLVMLAFIGPYPEGQEVCHNDGNPANNRLDNLRYDTHSANMRETKNAFGPKSLNSRLAKKQMSRLKRHRAKLIRIEYAAGEISREQLAEKYEMHPTTISLIVSGRRRLEAGGPINGRDYKHSPVRIGRPRTKPSKALKTPKPRQLYRQRFMYLPVFTVKRVAGVASTLAGYEYWRSIKGENGEEVRKLRSITPASLKRFYRLSGGDFFLSCEKRVSYRVYRKIFNYRKGDNDNDRTAAKI